ncbi:MAG: hypothetical protein ACK559_35670, partial [bacterium]
MLQDELAAEEKLLGDARAAYASGAPPPLPEERGVDRPREPLVAMVDVVVGRVVGRAVRVRVVHLDVPQVERDGQARLPAATEPDVQRGVQAEPRHALVVPVLGQGLRRAED